MCEVVRRAGCHRRGRLSARQGLLRLSLTRVAAATTPRPDAVGPLRRHGPPSPARSDTMVPGWRFRHDRNGLLRAPDDRCPERTVDAGNKADIQCIMVFA